MANKLVESYFKPVGGHQVLVKPLNIEAMKKLTENERLSVNIAIPLGPLIGFGGVDALNDYAEEHILDSSTGAIMADISYRIVGSTPEGDGHGWLGGAIIINVNADVSDCREEAPGYDQGS